MKFILFFLISMPAFAGYFTDHVKESIVINKSRKVFYSKLSEGKSNPALKKLIFWERVMLPFAMTYDLRASWYQRRGIPVLKDEFVPMISLPEIEPRIPHENIRQIPWENYRKELEALIKMKNQEKLLSRSLEIIHELETQKEYWCLTRHLVESIYRIAWFLPQRIEEARLKNIKSPEKLIWDVISFHLVGFSRFARIDLKAAPIQKEGIPMICSELPDLLNDL